ncbi:hypothetical protein MKW92_022529, partial [Papaver armeniacum]
MVVGTTFVDKLSYKNHLKHFCVLNEYEYKVEKSDKKRLRVWCAKTFNHRGTVVCKWYIFASKLPNQSTFKVRGMKLKHKCKGSKDSRNRTADPSFEAKIIMDKMKNSSMKVIPKPRQICNDFEASHLIKIPYQTAWKARNLVLDKLHGSYEDNFKDVPQYCKVVTDTNPGT